MKCRSRTAALLHRFTNRTDGAAAIEMGIVAIPLFALLFATIEMAMIYVGTASLDSGLLAASRQIRTGQAQNASMSAQQFRDLVCGRITPLLTCDDRLVIDVRRFSSFGGIVVPPPLDQNGEFAGGNEFQIGGSGDIVIARAYYAWPLVSPTSFVFSTMTGDSFMLSAATAFRNEPF